MPDIYTEITLEQLIESLANKLGDQGMVFHTLPELIEIINESLQTWAAFSGYWTERKLLTLRAGIRIYDLPSEPELTPLAYTVTQTNIIQQIKRALLEPDIPGSFTEQFDNPVDNFPAEFQGNYEQWLLDSGLITVYQERAGQAVIPLPEQHLEFRFVEWKARPAVDPATHYYTRLYETTDDSTHYEFYMRNGQPRAYVPLTQPVNSVRLYPPPEDVGELAFFSLQLPAPAQLGASSVPIPPALGWVLKYGLLKELLDTDGQVRDPFRAQYCKSRVEDAGVLSRNYPSVYNAWLNGVPIRIGTLRDLAARQPYWHTVNGAVQALAMLSWNHLIVYPAPTSEVITDTPQVLELEIQSLPPALVSMSDKIQLPRSYHNMIVDFAQHLAMFKLGGAEFTKTLGAYKELLTAAMEYNQRLQQQQSSLWLFKKRATADYARQPRFGDERDRERGEIVMAKGRG